MIIFLSLLSIRSQKQISFHDDGTLIYQANDKINEISVIGRCFKNKNPVTNITIPSQFKGTRLMKVTAISDYAFCNEKDIIQVSLSNLIEKIGNFAFCNCTNMLLVFESVPYFNEIGNYSFANCSKITNLKFSISEIVIRTGSFYGCTSLKTIEIKNTFEIPDFFVANCVNLEKIVIPSSITSIGATAFENLPSLQQFELHLNSLDSCIKIENGSLYYKQENETNYELVKFPAKHNGTVDLDGVSIIWKYAFQYCDLEGNITIPETVTTIYSDTFRNCSSIKRIIIGANVLFIEDGAFMFMGDDFEEFVVDEANENYTCESGALLEKKSSKVICYSPSFKNASIPASAKEIGDYGFANSLISELINLTNITSLGAYAFADCESIAEVIFNNLLEEIPEGCFSGCISLEKIQFPSSLKQIKKGAFKDCISIQGLTFPQTTNFIGEYAFYGCSNISTTLVLPSINVIKAHSFQNLISVVHIMMNPCNASTIEEYAFAGCVLLDYTNILGDTLREINEHAFDGCESLSSFIIGKDLTNFSYDIMKDMKSLATISIGKGNSEYVDYIKGIYSRNHSILYKYPASLSQSPIINDECTEIASYAFAHSRFQCCSVPTSCEIIREYAFYNSSVSFISIISITSIGDFAFRSCKNLGVAILKEIKEIGKSAFTDLSSNALIIYEGDDEGTEVDAFDESVSIYVINDNIQSFFGKSSILIDTENITDLTKSLTGNCPDIPDFEISEETTSESTLTDSAISTSSSDSQTTETEHSTTTESGEKESTSSDDSIKEENDPISEVTIAVIVVVIVLLVVFTVLIIFFRKKIISSCTGEEDDDDNEKIEEIKAIDIPTTTIDVTHDVPSLNDIKVSSNGSDAFISDNGTEEPGDSESL